MTDSDLTRYARRAVVRSRRLAVIGRLMHGATGVRLATLVACWCKECGR